MKTPSSCAPEGRSDPRVRALLDRLGRTILLATIILVPGAFWMGFADNFEVPKQGIFRSLILVLWLVTLVLPERRRLLWAGPAGPALGAVVLAAMVSWWFNGRLSVGWSGEEGSWMGASGLAGFALAAAAAGPWLSGRMLNKAAAGVFLAASLLLIYSIVQLAGWDPVSWNPQFKSGHWIFGMLGNPVHLANYLACAFLLSLCMFPLDSRLAWLFRALLLSGILATRQESAIAAMAAGVFMYAMLRRRPRLAVLLLAIAAAFYAFAGSLTDSLGSRPAIWRAAGRIIRSSPIVGTGPGLFYSDFPRVADYGYFAAEPPIVKGGMVQLRLPASAHNEPIDWAACLGLVGLGIYIWIIAVAVRSRREPRLLPAAVGLWVVHSANPPSLATASLFWLMLAFLAGVPRVGTGGTRLFRGLASGCAVALLAAFAFSGWGLIMSQAYRQRVNGLVFFGETREALAASERWSEYVSRLHPGQAHLEALFLNLYRKENGGAAGQSAGARAIELEKRACAANPRNIFYPSTLAQFELERGREYGDAAALSRSESLLRALRGAAPEVLSLNDDLAEVLEERGKGDEARKLRREREVRDARSVFRPNSTSP